MPLTVLDPTTALIVVDIQQALATRELAPHTFAEIRDRSHQLALAFHDRGLPVVIVTVDDVPPGRTDLTGPRPTLSAEWSRSVPPLSDDNAALRIVKQSPGAFTATGLDELLRERGVTQVVVTGVSTSVGVEMTARQAFELGYHVTVALDACTDTEADRHTYSAAAVLPRVAETGSTDDVLALLALPR